MAAFKIPPVKLFAQSSRSEQSKSNPSPVGQPFPYLKTPMLPTTRPSLKLPLCSFNFFVL